MQEELPSYSTATETPPTFAADAGQHGPTPRYVSNRPSFTVGKQSVQALITAQDIRAHLTLLRAFQDLHSRVLDQKHIPHQDIPNDLLSPSSVWGWFLAKAAWRFELWLKFVIQSHQEAPQDHGRWRPEEIPPLDVLLVWHAFLLVSECELAASPPTDNRPSIRGHSMKTASGCIRDFLGEGKCVHFECRSLPLTLMQIVPPFERRFHGRTGR